MPSTPRDRLGMLRVGAAALATANVVVGVGALLLGLGPTAASIATAAASTAPSEPAAAPATVLVSSRHPLLITVTSSTTATTVVPTPPTNGPSRTRSVVSTGYCLQGTTASGEEVRPGIVAMNGVPLGSRWRVHDGPFAGVTLEAKDRIGHSTEFDIWFADCADAVTYGRRTITVERVG